MAALKGVLNVGLILAILAFSTASVAAQTIAPPNAIVKIVGLNEPAVVLIFEHYVATFTYPDVQYRGPDDNGAFQFSPRPGFPQMSVKVDVGDFGSGFIFNPDGYIMTNAHVATSQISRTDFLYDLAQNYTQNFVRGLSLTRVRWSAWMTDNYQRDYFQFIQAKGSFSNERTEVIVMFGQYQNETNAAVNDLTSKGVNADVKAVGVVGGKDVAVIKVNMPYKLPTVQFGDSDMVSGHLGEQVVVLGYPAMSTDIPQASGVRRWRILQGSGGSSGESSIVPTATSGIASAVKTVSSKDGQLTYIQTDASIHPGNSGGPAFDPDGDVVGLATLGASDPNNPGAALSNVGFLLPINTALEYTNQINVKNVRGPMDTYWAEGLNLFWAHHYSAAVEQFQKVQALYPVHPYAGRFIRMSQTGISRGQDIKLEVTAESTGGATAGPNVGGAISSPALFGVVGVLVAVIVVVFFIMRRRPHSIASSAAPVKKNEN